MVESILFNAARPTVTLLVEGKFDERFWRMHTTTQTLLKRMDGRQKALDKLDSAGASPDSMLVAILDADLDRFENQLLVRADVIWTDGHDLETTLLGLPVLEKIVRQKIDPQRLDDLEMGWKQSLRARLFAHADSMGRLRWLKQRDNIEFGQLMFVKTKSGKRLTRFDKYGTCVDQNWSPSRDHVITAILNYSSAHGLKIAVSKTLPNLPDAALDQVCNGHDLVGFLHAWLKEESDAPGQSIDALTDQLSSACEGEWLRQTRMWQDLEAWQNGPGRCVVLR